MESVNNIGLVCDLHAPKPGKFININPSDLLGKYVKIAFSAIDPRSGKATKEHMWVEVTELATIEECPNGEQLIGRLDNDPIFECDFAFNEIIGFKLEEIEDLLLD